MNWGGYSVSGGSRTIPPTTKRLLVPANPNRLWITVAYSGISTFSDCTFGTRPASFPAFPNTVPIDFLRISNGAAPIAFTYHYNQLGPMMQKAVFSDGNDPASAFFSWVECSVRCPSVTSSKYGPEGCLLNYNTKYQWQSPGQPPKLFFPGNANRVSLSFNPDLAAGAFIGNDASLSRTNWIWYNQTGIRSYLDYFDWGPAISNQIYWLLEVPAATSTLGLIELFTMP
jgi:hypothetical protein